MSQTMVQPSSQDAITQESKHANPTKNNTTRQEVVVADEHEEEDGSEVKRIKSLMLPPQTPGRVSLLDLLANPEDFSSELPQGTPSEQITWKHVPGLLRSPSSSARTTQKSKKRSHSSSPVSSQARRSKHFRADKESSDLKSLSQSRQKSPSRRSPNQEDPASILWNHYNNQRRLCEPVLPTLPPFEPSPHTPVDNKKDVSFRRTASCGSEWPTSNPKRRKLAQPDLHSTTKQIFASRRKELLECELPQQSKVTILLETVQQSLAARDREHDAPSSSSPLPEKSEAEDEDDDDGSSRLEGGSPRDARPTLSPQRLSTNPAFPHGSSPLKGKAINMSDLSDLDFDEDDLASIEEALTQGQAGVNSAEERPAPEDCVMLDEGKDPPANEALDAKRSISQPLPTTQKTFDDDFDDFDVDDNILDEELTILAEKVDSQQAEPTSKFAPQTNRSGISFSSGDALDLDDNDFDDVLLDTTKQMTGAAAAGKQIQLDSRTIKRYLVYDVSETTYSFPRGRKCPEKLLSIKDEKTKQCFVIHLRQSWYDTRCVTSSYVHLIGKFDAQGRCVVDDNNNMLILHPDHLISATVIGDAITCLRRAVLQDRVKATSPPEKSQVYGHILHEVFGGALRLNDWEWTTFGKIIDRLLPNYLESLYEIGMPLTDTKEYLMTKVPLMRAWADLFVSATFKPDAVLRDRKGSFIPTAIDKLLEIEEHVWSPMYGLKGNIDATVQAKVHLPENSQAITVLAPLELKTGKKDNNEAHRAQTALYTLLLSDRYDVEVTSGVLYYMETSKTFRIEGVRNEIRQMIIWRNLLASYVHDKIELPPMIKKEFMCKRCYAQTSCFAYHKLVEGGDGESSGLKEIFDDAVGHLQTKHQSFFKRWDDLLTKEERDCMKNRRELWTMLSSEREQVGRCFSNLIVEPGSAVENQEGSKINRYTYSFVKSQLQTGFSFTESQIAVGEPIVISDEQGHFALANGYVTSVRPRRITVAVDRKLHNARKRTRDFDPIRNQSFVGIMEVTMEGIPASSAVEDDSPILYRLDKDEFSNGMATVRNNLIRIMEKDLFRARELRELIVENKPPAFKHMSTAYSLTGPASQQNINVDQRAAIEKVMSARDYALVLGMPGTGKTTTIAHIIRALVSQGKSVLLTSYTHTAVDNILLKIKDDNIPILRLGAVAKVHSDVQAFADLSGVPKKSMEELERSWANSKVVATTCLSINHGIFNHRIFDYCIVDEASQITLPVCMGPIRFAHTFILVGDHYQLPPLVQDKDALEGGLDISLFKLLSDAQPDSVVSLEHQYRMAEDIMLLSNELIYSGRLKCGNDAVATRMLQIPSLQSALDAHHHHSHRTASSSSSSFSSQSFCTPSKANCFLRVALLPTSRTVFLNTDTITQPMAATEILTGSNQRITNPSESLLTAHLLTTLIRAGVPARSIGVITFYRSQLALLRHDVKTIAGSAAAADVEMHTADKYQGRDKEVILLSFVRSNSARSVGELLKDWRRVNVAITRAKSKLIMIGSKSTLEGSGVPVLEGLIKIVNNKRWLIDLPADATSAENGHKFEAAGPTQTQQPPPRLPKTITANVAEAVPEKAVVVEEVQAPAGKKPDAPSRKPLAPIQANGRNTKIIGNRNNHLPNSSMKVNAPFKRPTLVKNKSGVQPQKTITGAVDLEKLFDKRPIMRDIANEVTSGLGSNVNIDMTGFNENDFEDDEMLLDF